MLEKRDKGIVYQIIKRCNRIIEKTNKISQEIFINDEDIKEVICFNLFQIG